MTTELELKFLSPQNQLLKNLSPVLKLKVIMVM